MAVVNIVLVTLVLVCAVTSNARDLQRGYGCLGDKIGEKCLTFSNEKLSWHDAKEKCSSQNATLASLDDPQAFRFYAIKKYGSGCHFPFIFGGTNYTTCSYSDSTGRPWCSTKTNPTNQHHIGGNYIYCDQVAVECQFPFFYDGKSYSTCTQIEHSRPWCSTKTDKNRNHIFKYWKNCEAGEYWLGGSDITNEGDWQWLDGRPLGSQFPWPKDGSQPNNYDGNKKCLNLGLNNNYNGETCTKKFRFVCEDKDKQTLESEAFFEKYNKTYENDAEAKKRKAIFMENYAKIENHNKLYYSGKSSFRMGVNEFSDLTYDEVISQRTGVQESDLARTLTTRSGYYIPKDIGEEPEYLDYRDQGAINPIRDQGYCGSCWAFTAVANIESNYFIKSGDKLQMSEQDLVDCSMRNNGCNGGNLYKAFHYVMEKGIGNRSEYEYTARDGICKEVKRIYPVKGMTQIRMYRESELLNALVHEGPISIHMWVSDNFFQYKDGVFFDHLCKRSVNHGMLLVGYGTEKGQDYWLLRNSWGESFGEKGYIKMARNVENDCSISMLPVFPVITGPPYPLIPVTPVCEDTIGETFEVNGNIVEVTNSICQTSKTRCETTDQCDLYNYFCNETENCKRTCGLCPS